MDNRFRPAKREAAERAFVPWDKREKGSHMPQPLIENVYIECDPGTAFDLMADVRNETRWSKGVSVAELRSEGPVREGSRFRTVYRGMENDVTIAAFDRPRHLVVVATSKAMDFDTTYTFTGVEEGTNVVVSTDLRPKGPIAAMSPLLRLMLRRELANKFAAVKRAIEHPSVPSPV